MIISIAWKDHYGHEVDTTQPLSDGCIYYLYRTDIHLFLINLLIGISNNLKITTEETTEHNNAVDMYPANSAKLFGDGDIISYSLFTIIKCIM